MELWVKLKNAYLIAVFELGLVVFGGLRFQRLALQAGQEAPDCRENLQQ